MKIGLKLWPLECSLVFSMIWPTDQVFDPTWLIFELNWDFIISSRQRFWQIFMMIGCIMWPVLCSQGFFIIWPTDLVFDRTWPIFELDRDIVKMIILSKIDGDWTRTVASRVFTRFFYDLAYWPSFWPIFELDRMFVEISSRQTFWQIFMMIGCIMWYVLCSQGFSIIWPTDLVFDRTWPIFELDLDIVKMIILSKVDENWTRTVASRVFTRFFYNLAYRPSFWPNMTHFRTWPRFQQDKHSDKFSWWLDA